MKVAITISIIILFSVGLIALLKPKEIQHYLLYCNETSGLTKFIKNVPFYVRLLKWTEQAPYIIYLRAMGIICIIFATVLLVALIF